MVMTVAQHEVGGSYLTLLISVFDVDCVEYLSLQKELEIRAAMEEGSKCINVLSIIKFVQNMD